MLLVFRLSAKDFFLNTDPVIHSILLSIFLIPVHLCLLLSYIYLLFLLLAGTCMCKCVEAFLVELVFFLARG